MDAGAAGGWLPPHQHHSLYTTAHVDSIIGTLTAVLTRYQRDDPIDLGRRFTETEEQLVLVGIKPLPEAVSRLFADALNAARNSLEHALFSEVADRLGRPLTESESKALEVPATVDLGKFDEWAGHKHRASLGLLVPGADLYERLLRLQPFQRKDSGAHPLRVLAAHTNYAKHREPAVAYTRVARVIRDTDMKRKPTDSLEVAEIGDVLAAVPRGTKEEFSVWPEVAVQRPHTGEWVNLVGEVGALVNWVRTMALPILILGNTHLPSIPPQLDITITYETADAAWRSGGEVPAAKRMANAIGAEGLRESMLDMLVDEYGEEARTAFHTWLASMEDAVVMDRVWPQLERAARGDVARYLGVFKEWALEAGAVMPDDAR